MLCVRSGGTAAHFYGLRYVLAAARACDRGGVCIGRVSGCVHAFTGMHSQAGRVRCRTPL